MTLKVDGRFGNIRRRRPTKTVMNGGARAALAELNVSHLGNEELARDARASGHNKVGHIRLFSDGRDGGPQ